MARPPGLSTIAADVLQHACEIPLPTTTATELEPLRGQLSKAEFDAVRRHGLAAYLVAGPALQRKLTTARHAPGSSLPTRGRGGVHGSDWARCGRTDPISEATLRQLWSTYLPTGLTPGDDGFDTGLAWALRPVAGTIALLHRTGSYQPVRRGATTRCGMGRRHRHRYRH